MPVLQRPGVGLQYEIRGTGPTVLCVHGTPSTREFWEEPAQRLASTARCVTYDRRGFGDSTPSPPVDALDLDEHVADAAALLEALGEVPAVVIGRSTGGLVALALAQRRPELLCGVALLEPAVFGLDPEAASWARDLGTRVLDAEEREPGSASRAVFDLALGEEVWPSLDAEVQALFARCSAAVAAEIRGVGLDLSADPFVPELASIDLPVLVVSATDSYAAARRVDDALVDGLRHAVHTIVPGGHLIDPAGPAVLDFVARVTSGHPSTG
ncbi:alpha/beta fold hydrolase [Nocardioides sp.]|uniref:alpha/beta fold hydrolase n=1 Tax=Nocardioides sp. TaxID=35761 RepID=UPI0035B33307